LSLLILSAIGGWVMNKVASPPPRKGFTMNMFEDEGLPNLMGSRRLPASSFSSARARCIGRPMSLAPSRSALYSRLRDMASCTIIAAMGAVMARTMAMITPPSFRRPPNNDP